MSPRLLALLVAVGLAAGFSATIAARGIHRAGSSDTTSAEPATTAPQVAFEGALVPPGVRAPDFSLRDQDGRRATMASYRGRPVVVTFASAGCAPCPAAVQQVKGALDDLGKPVPTLAISVDPAADTPAGARRFLTEQGMTGRMRYVLGKSRELEPVWRAFGVQRRLGGAGRLPRIVLVDARGLERVAFPGSQATPERIAHDLRLLGGG